MATSKNTDWKSYLNQLTDTLELYLVKKAPAIPDGGKEFIVKVAPWLTIIGLIFGVLGILALVGIGAVAVPLSVLTGGTFGFIFVIGTVFLVISLVLEALALNGLFKRQEKGWTFMYYAMLVGVVHNVISFNLPGLIIGSLLGLYILFQIRSYYK